MADAVALNFYSPQRRGVGTSFACRTKIGPFTTTDEMEIDHWEDGVSIGVTHRGAVTATGRFVLEELSPGVTLITWSEALTFPWWMGGSLGGALATPLLRWIWRSNLARFARQTSGSAS